MGRLALPPGRWAWIAPLVSLGAAAAITAIIVLLLFGDDEEDSPADDRPATAQRIELRSAPSEDATVIAMLESGAELSIDGRSSDEDWVQVRVLEGGATGWLPTSAIWLLPDLGSLAVVGPSETASATPTPTQTATEDASPTLSPDFPDLVVSEVFARDNHIYVVISNEGSADVTGPIEVAVDGGVSHRIDTGKALRPGDRLEQALEGEYVQRRGQVSVTVSSAGLVEENAGNNVFTGVVEPDAPNDLEVADVAYGGEGPHLQVSVRNHSPIPLHGPITIGIRQTTPQNQLLVREERQLDVDVDGTQTFDFIDFTGIPLDFVLVIVSSDEAITDADSSNNTFPR